MSETNAQAITTDPIPNAPSVDPPAPEPAPAPDPAPAETAEEEKRDEEQKQQARQGDKRFAVLTARLSAAERVQEQQRAELEFWRAQRQQPATSPDTPEAQHERMVAQIRAEETMKIRAETFHADGGAQFPDWQKKCTDLMAMGADAGFASLLVEIPGGVRVAAALADDPEEVQRIAGIRSERGRAVALGAYAAKLGNGANAAHGANAAPASLPVTRAPAPVSTGERACQPSLQRIHGIRSGPRGSLPQTSQTLMPSKSKAQANMMRAAAHNPAFAKKVGVPPAVAKEFSAADEKRGTKKLPERKPTK